MKYEIKHRWTGKVLFSLGTKSLKLCVQAAIKCDADLGGAYLRDAYLRDADLRGANKYRTTPLYMLLDQVGKIRAYKLVNSTNQGPYQGGITYEIGKTVKVDEFDTNETKQCSFGISLASLDWCLKEYKKGYIIFICEFTKNDIAAIPISSDGKFRVKKCKVIREKSLKKTNKDF